MDKLLEILEDIKPGVDYENCKTLVTDGILESFSILALVNELEDEFDIEIGASDLKPVNFNSAEALWKMIERLKEED